jgi:hypothetical protein
MDTTEPVALQLTVSDAELLIESLDSHEYWQIGVALPRKDGYVFVPGDMEPDLLWTDREPSTEELVAISEVERCRELADRLRDALASRRRPER